TGRLMYGRRYSDGLHQAIEAKENVEVERESKTLATITFQNFFRLYSKLSGMTGTALTEEEEFRHIYALDVIEIPTNKPVIRIDHPDIVYRTKKAKYNAVVAKVEECIAKGQPIMVGTVSIDVSEHISKLLSARNIKHEVLNAKYHEREAEIVAQAGRFGAVTIATNMAGRGTDIKLGGNADFLAKTELIRLGYLDEVVNEAVGFADTTDETILETREKYKELLAKYSVGIKENAEKVRNAGGLYVLGTERHESRRIDNQLRGRSGRQGDPGESTFVLSLEDDLMRLFGSERVSAMMETLRVDDNMPIEHSMLTNTIESAQKRVEGRNFQARKTVLEYDDVMNMQRNIIYSQRATVLNGEDIKSVIEKMIRDSITREVASLQTESMTVSRGDLETLRTLYEGGVIPEGALKFTFGELESLTYDMVKEIILEAAEKNYEAREQEFGSRFMREAERVMLLRAVDTKWMNHIDDMQELRRGIGLRAFAQKDPVIEYKREGFDMFEAMIAAIQDNTTQLIYRVRPRGEEEEPKREKVAKETGDNRSDGTLKKQPIRKKPSEKVGRNDPCPCGSGKKYKRCCGFDQKPMN
ncbi:MAG: preprotein translocase subunit SecA, partial [Clostridiales bacterium]|nr:preprotein translocase subunit SecA [Clostridiales bacterium]